MPGSETIQDCRIEPSDKQGKCKQTVAAAVTLSLDSRVPPLKITSREMVTINKEKAYGSHLRTNNHPTYVYLSLRRRIAQCGVERSRDH